MRVVMAFGLYPLEDEDVMEGEDSMHLYPPKFEAHEAVPIRRRGAQLISSLLERQGQVSQRGTD